MKDRKFAICGSGVIILFFLALTLPFWLRLASAACTNTTNISLCKPAISDSGWGASLNNNFDLIDAQLPGLSSGDLKLTTNATCGAGYTEYTAARGRFLVGVPASGTNAGTVGTALTDLQDKTHTHTYTDVPNHVHSVDPPSTSVTVTDPQHAHNPVIFGNTGTGDTLAGINSNNAGSANPIPTKSTGITASVDILAFNSANPTGGVATGTTATTALSSFLGYIQLRLCQRS